MATLTETDNREKAAPPSLDAVQHTREISFWMRLGDDLRRFLDSDIVYSFKQSPVVMVSTVITVLMFVLSFGAPILAPYDTFDPAQVDLMMSERPPIGVTHTDSFGTTLVGDSQFLLGTDDQGRDMLSAIMFGMRTSLIVGVASVALAMLIGVGLGLIAGYVGGHIDAFIMRVVDITLSFPTILIALLFDGLARSILPRDQHAEAALYVVIFAIAASIWVTFARTVRGSTMVEKNKEYVQAARVIGVHPVLIMVRHVLPNVLGPVLVIATISLALAIIAEATLSFLGVGVPPTQPSLGTLIRFGNNFLTSGMWWMTVFPSAALVILALSVNLLGDWLRDALNPKLR